MSTEYIERWALMAEIGKHIETIGANAERLVARFPAADVEPVVRGVWVEMRDPYGDLMGWIHEECGRETNSADEYCSKCGAKMTFIERSGSGDK